MTATACGGDQMNGITTPLHDYNSPIIYEVVDIGLRWVTLDKPYDGPSVVHGEPKLLVRTNLSPGGLPLNHVNHHQQQQQQKLLQYSSDGGYQQGVNSSGWRVLREQQLFDLSYYYSQQDKQQQSQSLPQHPAAASTAGMAVTALTAHPIHPSLIVGFRNHHLQLLQPADCSAVSSGRGSNQTFPQGE